MTRLHWEFLLFYVFIFSTRELVNKKAIIDTFGDLKWIFQHDCMIILGLVQGKYMTKNSNIISKLVWRYWNCVQENTTSFLSQSCAKLFTTLEVMYSLSSHKIKFMNNFYNKSYIYVIRSNAISNTSKQFLLSFLFHMTTFWIKRHERVRICVFFFFAFGLLQMKKPFKSIITFVFGTL